MWSKQEHVRRALMYGKPKDEEDLLRLLIPNSKGLWEHKMTTKDDIIHNASYSERGMLDS